MGLRRSNDQRSSVVWTVLLIVGYALWNLLAVLNAQAQESFDTYRYFGLVFDVQNPGFTTTALFMLIDDHQKIIYVLTFISVIAWSLLILALVQRLRYSWIRWPLAILILFFSMTTPIWNYNTVLLTESLTVSTLILWFAAIVWLTNSSPHRSKLPLVALLFLGGFAIFTRPQLLVFIVPVQIILLIWISRRNKVSKMALITGLGLVPFVGIGLYRMFQLSAVQLYQFRYALNNLVDKGSSFRPYALENMPQCDAIPTALNGPAPWNEVQALEGTLMNSCPETWIWFNSADTSIQAWILSDPIAAFLDFIGSMTRVHLSVMSEGRAMPEWLSNVILNPTEPWLWMLIYLFIGVGAALIVGVRPRVTTQAILSIVLVILACAGFIFIMWASDGYDISRHIFPVLPLFAVAFLVFPSTIPDRKGNSPRVQPVEPEELSTE